MHRLHVLILQPRPFHQLHLHQAFNALGIYNVRLVETAAAVAERLGQGAQVDILLLDRCLPLDDIRLLLSQLPAGRAPRALLSVGKAHDEAIDFRHEARRHGLWFIGELPWSMLTANLHKALQLLVPQTARSIETVMLAAHPR